MLVSYNHIFEHHQYYIGFKQRLEEVVINFTLVFIMEELKGASLC